MPPSPSPDDSLPLPPPGSAPSGIPASTGTLLSVETGIQVLRAVVVSADRATADRIAAGLAARGHLTSTCRPAEAAATLEATPPPDTVLWHLDHRTAAEAASLLKGLPEGFLTNSEAPYAIPDPSDSIRHSGDQSAAGFSSGNPDPSLSLLTAAKTPPAAADPSGAAGRLPPAFIIVTDEPQPLARVEAWLGRGAEDFLTLPGSARGRTSPSPSPPPAAPGSTTTTVPSAEEDLLPARLAVLERLLLRRREQAWRDSLTVQSVRRYEEIFRKSPEATLIVSTQDGLILEANAAAGHMLGIPRPGLLHRYLSLVLPDLFDREDYRPEALAPDDTLRLTEVRHQRPDRSRRWLEVLVTRIPWPSGHALLIKFHDLTVLKEREARRLHEARLDAASRVMGGTARELSDVLTSVRGNLELLLRQPASMAEVRDLAGGAHEACNRAVELGKRLASLARLPLGGDLRRRPVGLKSLLEKTVPFALLHGRARPVLRISGDLWPVEADEAALTELLRRLTENAEEAMPGGGTLFVDAVNVAEGRPEDDGTASVRIRLRDEGHGIDPGHLPRIFDPWFSTRPGRDGMGLTQAAALAKAHGGHLQAESQPGQGTTLTLWLPVNLQKILHSLPPSPPPSDGTAPIALLSSLAAASIPGAAPRPPARARVLFMDDDTGIRAMVRRILTTSGFDVHCTADGREAIEAWRKALEFATPFDLLLADLDVRGGMGGKECVALLKQEFPSLKALLTTGYIDDELMETYRDHGFMGVIPKPFQLDRLVQAISRLLGV